MRVTRTTTKTILKAASDLYGEPLDRIKSARSERFFEMRLVIYETCRMITNESVSQIARAMGKDHTTVLHWLKKDKSKNLSREIFELSEASLRLAQQMHDNTLQWSSLTCYNEDNEQSWKLSNG